MRGYRLSYFADIDTSDVDLLLADRASRINYYARRAVDRQPLFEGSKAILLEQSVTGEAQCPCRRPRRAGGCGEHLREALIAQFRNGPVTQTAA